MSVSGSGVGAPRGATEKDVCIHRAPTLKVMQEETVIPEQCAGQEQAPEMRDTEFWGRNLLRMNYTAPATLEEHLP